MVCLQFVWLDYNNFLHNTLIKEICQTKDSLSRVFCFLFLPSEVSATAPILQNELLARRFAKKSKRYSRAPRKMSVMFYCLFNMLQKYTGKIGAGCSILQL